MWRGGLRSSLSVAAPFVWRCLDSSTITPFPHPPHRTGQADLPHPALGQDILPSHTEGHEQRLDQPPGPCARASSGRIDDSQPPISPPAGNLGSPDQRPGSPFASACGAFRNAHTSSEFHRVAPISRALSLPTPALNQGPFPPPALPGLLGTTGLSATPSRPACPSRASGWPSRPTTQWGFPCCVRFPLCTCCRQYPGAATEVRYRSLHRVVSAFPDPSLPTYVRHQHPLELV